MAFSEAISHQEALDDVGACLFFTAPDTRRQARMLHLLTCDDCLPLVTEKLGYENFEGKPRCILAQIARRAIHLGRVTHPGLEAAVTDHFETCQFHEKPGVSRSVLVIGSAAIAVIAVIVLYFAFFR